MNKIDPEIQLEAQNHEQSLTSYIYINPELFNKPLDIFYADQDGDVIVSKQNRIPIEYFIEGPTPYDTKSWWFGPIE